MTLCKKNTPTDKNQGAQFTNHSSEKSTNTIVEIFVLGKCYMELLKGEKVKY